MHIKTIDSVTTLGCSTWNALVGGGYPFLRYEFLQALEESQATCTDSGWQPCHLVAYIDDQPQALMPLFIKDHSYGEYVFDWSWADAYHRAGFPYYPKLVTATPFTPATGPRLCIASDSSLDEHAVAAQFFAAVQQLAKQTKASSWHCLFPQLEVAQQFNKLGLSLRQACQFHWFNQDFTHFDDFLATFSSRKRKNLRKERQKIGQQGIELRRVEGTDVSAEDWQRFYQFYQLTYLKRSGHDGYLNQQFFELIGRNLGDALMMAQAYAGDEMVAAALFFKSDTHLYGRYWGCLEEFDGLHFEACYYQGIEYAIAQGLQCFDPGAQGEHKIQRGFTPTATWSNHWMAEPRFHTAIEDFTRREQPSIEAYMAEAATLLPFKQEP
ncbi:GNAT family N-acetyltransferase [Halioxenophilus aromaticivorans]|uniref:GNAT family N-acetyltransferase n=1 Tax=Halioxenophilus aromaticivorans TaxID=1306992 RepID=A0AAV3TXL3_9ALTE